MIRGGKEGEGGIIEDKGMTICRAYRRKVELQLLWADGNVERQEIVEICHIWKTRGVRCQEEAH